LRGRRDGLLPVIRIGCEAPIDGELARRAEEERREAAARLERLEAALPEVCNERDVIERTDARADLVERLPIDDSREIALELRGDAPQPERALGSVLEAARRTVASGSSCTLPSAGRSMRAPLTRTSSHTLGQVS